MSMDPTRELESLIAIAHLIVARQRAQVECLKQCHRDTSRAERRLRHSIASLQRIRRWRDHAV